MFSNTKHVAHDRNFNALCDIADEVERICGSGSAIVAVGRLNGLYVDGQHRRADEALAYARQLYSAACDGADAYRAALRD